MLAIIFYSETEKRGESIIIIIVIKTKQWIKNHIIFNVNMACRESKCVYSKKSKGGEALILLIKITGVTPRFSHYHSVI